MITSQERQTKYCKAIQAELANLGHATNLDLHVALQKQFPDVSATTVHRATARLAERGKIGIAPAMIDGSMRYDDNPNPHDHFMCAHCGLLKNTNVKDNLAPILEQSIGEGCSISGQLLISGTCKKCNESEGE